MRKNNFENLLVWKKSCRLAVELYRALADCRDFGLKDQMTRAAISIPSNVAEGSARGSNRDFVHFLHIAKGSAAELQTQIYIALEICIIKKTDALHFLEMTDEISAMLQGLIDMKNSDETRNEDKIPLSGVRF